MFNRKKKIKEKLITYFGKVKDDTFDFVSIEKYYRKKDKTNSFQSISDKTCNDLDFNEFFMFADRTTSKVGQQYLYAALRTIPINSEKFIIQEQLLRNWKRIRLSGQKFNITLPNSHKRTHII